jgi:hypothetical protein
MAIVQSTYTELQPIAHAGMLASSDHSVDTRICETAAGIGFGVAVSQGAADAGAVIGGASAAVFVGITVQDMSIENDPSNSDEYPRYSNMGVMTRGEIWVVTGGIVTAGADVTFASTTGVLSSAATSASQFAIAGARWMTSAASGALAKVRLSGSLPSA